VSGPVWRFEPEQAGTCDLCRRRREGLYVEGQVVDNVMEPARLVCGPCFDRWRPYVVAGEVGRRAPGPAYARGD
jgi:hypothetical protein